MNPLVHEPTDACNRLRGSVHCWIHNVDEPYKGAYRVCFECKHVYRTARELRRDYRKTMTQLTFYRYPDMPGPRPVIRNQGFGSWRTDLWYWFKSRFRRASRVYSCMQCSHDF